MTRMLTTGAATIAAALILAACGGGSDAGSKAGAEPAGTATVSAQQIDGAGMVVVDPQGKALYASDEEAGGKVLCTGACNSFWTPLTVGAGAPTSDAIAGKLGIAKRPDGARQVTYDGKLLYSFDLDDPGQVTGDDFTDAFDGQHFTWHVVHSDGTVGSSGGSTGGPLSY
jgi:predicted lipoprotein with Yx(FWY)xxD motif